MPIPNASGCRRETFQIGQVLPSVLNPPAGASIDRKNKRVSVPTQRVVVRYHKYSMPRSTQGFYLGKILAGTESRSDGKAVIFRSAIGRFLCGSHRFRFCLCHFNHFRQNGMSFAFLAKRHI
ncbi:hypothetical protein BLNAU_25300 [Blattamonas nauphoetae]|uniref:Uncharacterized protein n=1 Tax=Blattamonas nauphoetae TaxID=2049346 RepID=A0ABQ9WP16_9EUKA|nr:hypothetical protein BLNAU_25300 [Blattamonas nauphoetae]